MEGFLISDMIFCRILSPIMAISLFCIIVLCCQHNHIVVIIACVRMVGVMAVSSRVDNLLVINDIRLYYAWAAAVGDCLTLIFKPGNSLLTTTESIGV